MAMKQKHRPMIGTLATGVARTLEARIREGVLPAGRALPSERELSVELGVSRSVVRAAIGELAEFGLLDCRPNHRPVVRVSGPKAAKGQGNIGVWLWPNSSDFAAASILKGIQSTNLGSNQLVVASGAGPDWNSILDSERDFLQSIADDPTALGVIIWYLGGERNLPSLQKLQARRVPTVCVDRLPPAGFDVDYVGTNNSDSAMQAVRYLIGLGHHRIGMISNIDPASSVAEREDGYRQALVEAGIPFEDEWIQRVTYDAAKSIAAAITRLLRLPRPPTAIFCINDQLGLGAYDILTRHGVDVPGEISVIGFDGLLRWVPGGGYLTTMRQDFERIGRIAANLVLEKASGRAPAANRHYFLDAPLFAGASTAPPSADPSVAGRFANPKPAS